MLFVKIEAEKARLEKLQKEVLKRKHRIMSEEIGSWRTEQSDIYEEHLTKEPVASPSQPPIQDSKWFTLSPQDKLAWAKVSEDPRIAAGQQSPLEKKILNLGGAHTTAARQLIIQKYQEECETLCKEQALSLDYWFAKAESYYNRRIEEIMKEEGTGLEVKKKTEEKTMKSIEVPKRHYLVPTREMKHIERHIYRAGQARELNNKTFKKIFRPPSEITLPKIIPEDHGIQNAQRKQVNKREQIQIRGHQERMIRGRELIEQRLQERILRKSYSQPPTRQKCEKVKEEMKELERVTAYPLFQPRRSLIKVNILMEKSEREEADKITKPFLRKFLAVPPFLKSQIGKAKK